MSQKKSHSEAIEAVQWPPEQILLVKLWGISRAFQWYLWIFFNFISHFSLNKSRNSRFQHVVHAKETGTRGLTTKCGVVMKGGIVLVIIQLSTSMVGTELSTSNWISTSTIWTLFRNNKFILYEMLQQKSFKKEFTLWFFIFFHSLNMAKFKAFQWKISSSINLVFLKSEIWTWISCMVSSCK